MRPRLLGAAGAAFLAAAALAGRAAAQERVFVRPEPGTPVVAVQVLVGVGPVDEAPEQAGISYLAARAVVEPARTVLDSLGAHLDVDQRRDAIAFTLTAAPDAWAAATRVLMLALFRDPVDSASVVRTRTAIARELAAREASPADALEREVSKAVYGPDHPWGRPVVGTATSVRAIRVSMVDGFLRRNFTPERSVVAVVGPVEEAEARDELAPHMPAGELRTDTVPPPTPADAPVEAEYNSITTWVSATWRFGGDSDVEALRMLAQLALDRVSFGPSRRSIYNSRAEVVQYAGGGEVRLTIVVPPREAEQWAAQLREAVGGYAAEPLAPALFQERLRRFRGERLLELDLPEQRAAAMARAALLGDRTATLVDFTGLTPARLQAAARNLENPIIVFLGPAGSQGGGTH
ncbi:MAG TPA: insulinase family protein [Longimicrobium sp.]|nr:insulinase family protein [Longimicrobium sp.]